MEIKLTKEQLEQLQEDRYLNIGGSEFEIYFEFTEDMDFDYMEFLPKSTKRSERFWIDRLSVGKHLAEKPYDPSWYSNKPLCPGCQTNMILNFPYCPICGQKLDWSERFTND